MNNMASADRPQRVFEGEQSLSDTNVFVSLTYDELDASKAMARVKSPKAGAVVLFAGMPSMGALCLVKLT